MSGCTPRSPGMVASLLLQLAFLSCTGVVSHAARLQRSAVIHIALLWGGITPLDSFRRTPIGSGGAVFEKTHGFHPLSARGWRATKRANLLFVKQRFRAEALF